MPTSAIYALPLYYLVALTPHFYSSYLVGAHTPKGFVENTNPRGSNNESYVSKNLPPAILARYQRARGAHANAYESFPLFIAAVIAGTVARLDGAAMDRFAAGIVVLRMLYTVAYIGVEKQQLSFLRSVLWATSGIWCGTVLWQAAKVVAEDGGAF